MSKSFEVTIPKDAEADVVNQRSLRKSIFTRTRIALASFVMVMALGAVGATHAYLSWTANQDPYGSVLGRLQVSVGERTSLTADAVYDTDGSYDLGKNKKVVFVQSGLYPTSLDGTITVSVIPEVESQNYADNNGNSLAGAYQTFSQDWSSLKQETDSSGVTWDYIETSIMKVYLAQGWSENWSFQKGNGIFKYNKVLKKDEATEPLISGVVMQDTVNMSAYRNIKLTVIARSVQAEAE